jgi:saccharopine dehydrogenase (NAD+, L-lysine-forming)
MPGLLGTVTMSKKILWLRKEEKPGEWRVALTPEGVSGLVRAGIDVVVEKFDHRIFSDREYERSGARLTEESWPQAPKEAIILGLKELNQDQFPIGHRMIYFSHTFKGQHGASDVLERYAKGGGKIFDLEFLTNERGARVAAFGYWAGYVGAALALMGYAHFKHHTVPFPALDHFGDKEALIGLLRGQIEGAPPKTMVMGALGRCGRGAIDLLKAVCADIPISAWDKPEYDASDKPISAIIDHDIFINAVYLREKIPPMIDHGLLSLNQRLSIISDVSCDPNSDNNPVRVYDRVTSLNSPFIKVSRSGKDVYLQAIDHLPTILPKEASQEFGRDLYPHLLALLTNDSLPPVWQNGLDCYTKTLAGYGLPTLA